MTQPTNYYYTHTEEEGADDFYWTNGESLANYSFSYMTPEDTEAALATNESSCVFYQVAGMYRMHMLRPSACVTDLGEDFRFI